MTDELKNCPFCGGKTELDRTTDGYSVVCSECGATTGVSWEKKIVIDNWNKRNKYKYVKLERCPCCGGEAKFNSVICQGKAFTDVGELVKAWNTRTDTAGDETNDTRA